MIVVDASVAVKWFLSEAHSKEALALLSLDEKLVGPMLAAYEVAGAFVRARRRGDIDDLELTSIARRWTATVDSRILFLQYEPEDLLRASSLAVTIGHSSADCIYLAMAERLNAPLMTADKVFYEKVAREFPFVNFVTDISASLCASGEEI